MNSQYDDTVAHAVTEAAALFREAWTSYQRGEQSSSFILSHQAHQVLEAAGLALRTEETRRPVYKDWTLVAAKGRQ